MTPRHMVLAAVLVLTVVFLSPLAYLAGLRASIWLTTPAAEQTGPWPSMDETERDPGSIDRSRPPVRPGVGDI